MSAALTLILIGCLLQCVLCGEFNVIMPETIEALRGSCVTIPCSFDVEDQYSLNLDETCKAVWKRDKSTVVFDSSTQQSTIKGKLIGDLTKKDCTTTLDNMQHEYSHGYYFRVECNNNLKYEFWQPWLSISVTDDPPRPTLTPSTLRVKEETVVRLNCSAPAPCLSHPPTLTWTPDLGHSQETLQENPDKTKVKISFLTFTASHLHHGKKISCTATYSKQDGSTESVSTNVSADVSFAPQMLPSPDCTKAADQLNCSCDTVGNPSPTLQWYLDGSPVNHSDQFAISNEPLNDKGLRSIITVNEAQWRDLSTLLCHSSNSQGSATQRFYIYSLQPDTPATDQMLLTALITAVVALVVLVCALLFVIGAQKTQHNLPKSTVPMSQLPTSEEGSEGPNTTEEAIYANADVPRRADVAHPAAFPEPDDADRASKSSEMNNEEGSDVIYANVIWKSKSTKKETGEDAVDQSGEERCMVGNIVSDAVEMESCYNEAEPRNVKGVECEYAQVKFKHKSAV